MMTLKKCVFNLQKGKETITWDRLHWQPILAKDHFSPASAYIPQSTL